MAISAKDFEWDMLKQDQQIHSVVDLLGELPLFELLTLSELSKLEDIVHIRTFGPGETIIRAQAPRLGMYAIQSGSVHVVRRGADHAPTILGTLHPGELIGEFSLLDSSPRSSGIVAAEYSTLVGFFQPDLMSLIDTDPNIGFKILMPLTQMMAEQHRRDMYNLRQLRRQLYEHQQAEIEASKMEETE
jgi:CRP/FNR family cyclic AMP-dependent transcriptional regulator